jgi:hypothetical protein
MLQSFTFLQLHEMILLEWKIRIVLRLENHASIRERVDDSLKKIVIGMRIKFISLA